MNAAWPLSFSLATEDPRAAAPVLDLLPRFDQAATQFANQVCDSLGSVVFGPYEAQIGPANRHAGRRHGYRLRGAGISCRLWLDPMLEYELLGEVDPDLVPHDFRAVVLAHGLAPLIEAMSSAVGAALIMHRDADKAAVCGPQVGLRVSRMDTGATCMASLEIVDVTDWQGVTPMATGPHRAITYEKWQALPVPIQWGIGNAPVPLHELRRLDRGDVIVLDSRPAQGNALVLEARVLGLAHHTLHLAAEQSAASVLHIERTPMNDTNTVPGIQTAAIEALEVQVAFCIGQSKVPLHALARVQPGYVFQLDHGLDRSDVQVIANGRLIGRGSLIAVGNRLGVRVESLAGPDALHHE